MDAVLDAHPYLVVRPEDGEAMRTIKSYWHMVMALPKSERQLHYAAELVESEEIWLAFMIGSMDFDRQMEQWYRAKARGEMIEFEIDGKSEEYFLGQAEQWMQMARETKELRYTIKDIRKQRERVQWARQKLTRLQKKNATDSTASSESLSSSVT